MADLKLVYRAVTEEEALENLMAFEEKWSKKYPSCVKTWGTIGILLALNLQLLPKTYLLEYTLNIPSPCIL